MSELPEIGKISPEIFDELIYPGLGKKSNNVLVGPQHGVDIGVVDLGNGKVMATTTDPVFIVPEYGFERAAWFALHILVSDVVTSGLKPHLFDHRPEPSAFHKKGRAESYVDHHKQGMRQDGDIDNQRAHGQVRGLPLSDGGRGDCDRDR